MLFTAVGVRFKTVKKESKCSFEKEWDSKLFRLQTRATVSQNLRMLKITLFVTILSKRCFFNPTGFNKRAKRVNYDLNQLAFFSFTNFTE